MPSTSIKGGRGFVTKSPSALLLYEDESNCEAIREVLIQEGFEMEEVPLDMPISPGARNYDLVLLDIQRLDKRVLKISPSWRDLVADTTIIAIGRRTAQINRVAVLEAGVNAYLAKPLPVPELRARARSVLRRLRSKERPVRRLPFAGGAIDLEARTVRTAGKNSHLTPIECSILEHLYANLNHTVTTDDLVKFIWGQDPHKGSHSLRGFIYHLRKKLEDDPAHPRYLITEPATGYRLEIAGDSLSSLAGSEG
jgi:two-component system KDP operon response regulator KdpE